jgi:hypothetical protein
VAFASTCLLFIAGEALASAMLAFMSEHHKTVANLGNSGRVISVLSCCLLLQLVAGCHLYFEEHDDDTALADCTPGTIRSCYTGPEETSLVGSCTPGQQFCAADGQGYGACENEVLPSPELCGTGLDEDCNGVIGNDENLDVDGDGWSRCGGDCCETTEECEDPASVYPGSILVPSEMADCSIPDEQPTPDCDGNLSVDDASPMSAAYAMDICELASTNGWGLVSARYTRADGGALEDGGLQHGILERFGAAVTPNAGDSLLALSTGHARDALDADACGTASCEGLGPGTGPNGFPQSTTDCPQDSAIYDDISLELRFKAPDDATGFSFDFFFYSFEYPEFVCTTFNDQFVALMSPVPNQGVDGNIAVDLQGNPVSINLGYFDVCDDCSRGTVQMEGTGFNEWNDAGGTSWLTSTVPIQPGLEFTLHLMIWDAGDQILDSTVLLDRFRWHRSEAL